MIEAVLEFLAEGGAVLKLILLVTLIMWILICDRILFFRYQCQQMQSDFLSRWKESLSTDSWTADRIQESLLSQFRQESFKNIDMIKTLVNLCPLLGLLGTVTGMISVFDVMAITGTGNARLMASGISMATIPTMAGMVTALSGLYFSAALSKKAKTHSATLLEQLNELKENH